MHPYFSLQGRTALVTGGTRGIGKMIAKAFVEAGATVYVCARDGEACAQTAAELSAFGSCHGIAANLASEEGVQVLAEQLAGQIGSLDILVNNAGTTWGAPLESYPAKGWEKVMQLNVTSVFSCIQQLLPLLRKAGSTANPARVINIGSVAGITSHGEDAYAYGPSKAALHQLSRMLARELVGQFINVNVIAPGRFPSKMTQFIAQDEAAMAEDCALIPMQRWGREEEMAALAISLASTAGAYITGAIIPIDGGFHL
ncbi:3-oxoacyl-ACP reductase [Pseudomonas sp. HMWF032]|uniref:SDR family oxidoreductase n=1 Tax=unclassified Pseudomonas TaxID=196821 RepID=UPI000D37F21E|nr:MULTISPECIES: SDR family oxidoreductase [unclassified Pseudomonas]PTS83679.1 3-oxoacyl-ACP reductase [Pseudomonas sp. HMWF032]PTT84217.1 3-oxoacyl-ACP reductase [Pseudomonas sp. HMWF010]WAC44916.1 SDR family oxidoreductase [Pseudomonas sp. SL4(2022)]